LVGLSLTASNSTVRGLVINNSGEGIRITGGSGNAITGNYIGTDASGLLDRGNASNGVRIELGAAANTIGGAAAGARNVIGGNTGTNVLIQDAGSTGNVVAGNYIGTTAAGTAALGNGLYGVFITAGAANNRVGTDADGVNDANERNVISGHT